ncbi:threonine dehydratase [Coralliovum pocilloporae]|uniref:threonine dehydratase n=1 Tax=Coralliovum pocilloporae TaxID=3066369 RepID=UPI003306CBFF
MIGRTELEAAQEIVYRFFGPTPSYAWPNLAQALGLDIWLKHENHTPTGAFKVRGGLCYLDALTKRTPGKGVISATRGNHGQSLAYAARAYDVPCTIVVPHGNSREKNEAMRAFGAELIEIGRDFDEAVPHARLISEERDLHFVPSFAPELVAGVGTYSYEFLQAAEPDVVYVPIGLGSGICGMITARDALGLKTRIVGVTSTEADAYARSFEAGHTVNTNSALTFADGMAVRTPSEDAFAIIQRGADHIVTVTDREIADAIRLIFSTTHTLAEGAGAAAVAAIAKERAQLAGQRVGAVLSGQNIDSDWMETILGGHHPTVS